MSTQAITGIRNRMRSVTNIRKITRAMEMARDGRLEHLLEIIGPLVRMQEADDMGGLLAFTRMTGDLVKAMRACPQPIVAAVDGTFMT